MGALFFVCPTTGREVSTGIEIDPASYRGLPGAFTEIACPVCNETHNLSNVQPRVAGMGADGGLMEIGQ